MYQRLALFSLITATLCASWAAAQPMVGDAQTGQVVYNQHCVRCHGHALDGNGPDAPSLITKPANFHSRQSRLKTDWELLISISNGVLFTPMHGWRDRLTDQEMLDVLAYIRATVPQETIS